MWVFVTAFFLFSVGGEKKIYPKTISRLIRIVQTFHDVLVNLKKFLKLFLQKQMPLFSCHIWHCGRQFLRVKNILQLLEVTTIFLKKKREVMENSVHPQKVKGKIYINLRIRQVCLQGWWGSLLIMQEHWSENKTNKQLCIFL